MIIDKNARRRIRREYESWVKHQYADKSKEERQAAGQFFTPPVLSIKMLEKFKNLKGKILDPSAGAGGLLAAAIKAGADPKKCYGIELDPDIAEICRTRLEKFGVPRWHINVGNALDDSSYKFKKVV